MSTMQSVIDTIKNLALSTETRFDKPSAGEIHIWFANLGKQEPHIELLSQDEKNKAKRFIFEYDRIHYVARHSILRILLGNYLAIEPGLLLFNYNDNGKPAVANIYNGNTLHFNISDSEEMAVYSFSTDAEIGIDIEQIRDLSNMEDLSEYYFSPRENEEFSLLPENWKKEAFFNCWTRKEAFIKATGNGLSQPLNSFEVSLTPEKPARILDIKGKSNEVSQWFIQDVKTIPGYATSVALKSLCRSIQIRHWLP